MTSSNICQRLQGGLGALFVCVDQGDYCRVRTPFLYPDGDNIDLFCQADGDTMTITDLAETTGWLRTQSLAPRRSANQNRLIEDVCQTHGVEFYRGMLQARCHPNDDLSTVFTRVAQAALRVSDLWFTLRYRDAGQSTAAALTGKVAEYLTERRLQYEQAIRLAGTSQKIWDVDFRVHAGQRNSLVYVLNTGRRAAASQIADHVVAAYYDLEHHTEGVQGLQFVSLFNDTNDVWSAEDFRRVGDLSNVAYWSRPDEFISVLTESV